MTGGKRLSVVYSLSCAVIAGASGLPRAQQPVSRPASEPPVPSEKPAQAPQPATPDPAPDLLRGPTVEEGDSSSTLVKKDFAGKLERLDVRPEVAAIDVLGLSKEERAAADKVVTDRGSRISQFTLDHYDLFEKIRAARQGGGSRDELMPLLREARDAASEFFDPPFVDQVAAALPEAARDKYKATVADYRKALAAEPPPMDRAAAPASDDRPARRAARGAAFADRRVEMELFLREMGESFRAFVTDRREHADALLKAADATPEQENRIRGMLREFGAEKGFKPTPEQRGELMRKILAELTPDQRAKALKALREN